MNRTNYLLKNVGILTVSNFASKILVFLLVPLYTAVLTTPEYGAYDLAVSTASLLYPILTLNIVEAVMRFTMEKECSNEKVAIIGVKYLTISIILFSSGMIILNRFALWPDIHGLELFISLYYISFIVNQFLIQFAKGLETVRYLAIAGVFCTVMTIASNICFLLIFKWGLNGFFIANIVSQFSSALYLAFKIKIYTYLNNFSVDKDLEKEMLLYCIPLIATTLGWWVNSTADKYVVSFMLWVASNGILSVSYKIPQIINTLQGIFTQAWQISAIKEYGNEDTGRFYGRTFCIINVMMCAACSWLILLTKPLAKILYSNDFYQAWQYVPFLLIVSVLNCASSLLGPILSAKKDTKTMMKSSLIGAFFNIIFNISFVYFIGVQGVTIATVICSYIIYYIRIKAVKKEIIFEKYMIIPLTWFLLLMQAFIEIYAYNYILEIVLMMIMLILNIPYFRIILSKM